MSDSNDVSPAPTGSSHTPSWFDISSPDAARTRRFYKEMFDWPMTILDETYALIGEEGGQPTGGIGQASPGGPYTGIVVYFPVSNVDTALNQAEKLGGSRVMEPQTTPMGRIAVFADPDGNHVGVQGA